MIDVEFRIFSDHREGLLLQLGRVVTAAGYTLLRPRMLRVDQGVVLTVMARGPEANLLVLQDRLGSHPMVQSFEAGAPGASLAAPAADSAPPPRSHAQVNGHAHAATPPTNGLAASSGNAMADKNQIESLLGTLASEYPDVLSRVVAFERVLAPGQREPTLRYIGTRLGAWIYKRDFALGARLPLHDSVKNIALPAMRRLLKSTELHGDVLRISDSPFCGLGLQRGASCHFLSGCFEGLLNEPGHLGRLRAEETTCRNIGAELCTFAFTV
jgi:predicted hydrocarbon binding protein